jgi:hypothetical protein
MPSLDLAQIWFDRNPTPLLEWGGFFPAIRYELDSLFGDGHIGHAIAYILEEEPDEDVYRSEFDEPLRLSFSLYDDSIHVYFSDNKIAGDEFTISRDLTWSYDPEDWGRIGELTPEFVISRGPEGHQVLSGPRIYPEPF